MKVAFIGAGKVGFSLGKFLKTDRVIIAGYYSRHAESAGEAAIFTQSKSFGSLEELIGSSDVIFLTVPDGEITNTYKKLCDHDLSGKLLCHCSGMLSSKDAFPGIDDRGAAGISIHPLFPVSDRLTSYRKMAGAFFCLEGDPKACDEWGDILKELGANIRVIKADDKVRYHAACAIASNMVCALIQESVDILSSCGFTEGEALNALRPLAFANLDAIFEKGAVTALTGPVERLDTHTVQCHIENLGSKSAKRYRALSEKLVEMASKKHPERDYSELEKIL